MTGKLIYWEPALVSADLRLVLYYQLFLLFPQEDQTLTFDVETAIKVCCQANYHRHALALAQKYQRHDWYDSVQHGVSEYYMLALQTRDST